MIEASNDVWISAEDLSIRLGDPGLVLLDVRFTPEAGPDRDAYLRGHIPGAHFVDFPVELASERTATSGNRPLPSVDAWQNRLRDWGIHATTTVVVYDDRAGLSAARSWWLLRWSGVEARILDGGYSHWLSNGFASEIDEPSRSSGTAVVIPGALGVLDADDVLSFTASGGVLIDARKAVSYNRIEAADDGTPGGHIPGALSYPAVTSLDSDGTVLSPGVIREAMTNLGVDGSVPVGVYCGGGVAATHVIAALATIGIDASLYPGSWSEWVRGDSRPIEYAGETS